MIPQLVKHVPPDWPSVNPCKIAFVAEAPGEEEVLRARVLCGPSGEVFNQLLRTAGLDRRAYFVGNVFDEKIPDNDFSKWCLSSQEMYERKEPSDGYPPQASGYGWLQPEYHWHLERLRAELERIKPTLIVPMGGVALWAFTGSTGISEARGAIGRATRIMPGTKILPILHPAHVIHDWRMFVVTVSDLVKAAKEAEYPEVRWSKKEIWIEPSLSDLDFFKREYLDKSDIITIDIETQLRQIDCIGFGTSSERAIVVPFIDWRDKPPRPPHHSYWLTPEDEELAWRWVAQVCDLPQPKLLQNGPYDVYWLMEWAKIAVRNYRHDTRLLHHALYPELPKSLGFMGSAYANVGAWKTMREKKNPDKRDE